MEFSNWWPARVALLRPYLGRMKNTFLASCLLLAGCSTAPALPPPPTPQQAAVAAYVRANLPDSSSYAPVRWGKMTPYRASDAAAVDLAEASQQYAAATTTLKHDSAGYVLVSSTARQFNTPDLEVATVKQAYQMALTKHNSLVAKLRHAFATKADTTRLGDQLTHVFRAKTEAGQLLLDSAAFLVSPRGVVLPSRQAHNFPFRNEEWDREEFLGMAPTPPPVPPSLEPPSPSEVRAYLKQPMRR